MTEVKRPGVFYGTNVSGNRPVPAVQERGGMREGTLNHPGARQRPVEGAVTGPEAPPIEIDHLYNQVDLDELSPMEGPRGGA